MKKTLTILSGLCLLLLVTAFAQPNAPRAVLERFLTSDEVQAEWFTEAFLAQVPLAQITELRQQLTAQLGAFQRIEREESPFTLIFANGQATAEITLDGEGRISRLFFGPPTPPVATLDAAIEQFAALPGAVSVLVRKEGEALATLNADDPLAVGSAFKLAILAALHDQIAAGEHTWGEVVTLDPAWKSLPGGILQEWPDDSPLTIHTLATLMISISDNTAADTLLHIVGRAAVEEYAGDNQPLLTTQEAAKLKATPNADLLQRYQAGDEAAQRQVLAALAERPLPALTDLPSTPTLAVEWFFTPGELCDLMQQVQDLDLMTVNPGVANPADWVRAAFKGGAELGVLNFTHWLEAADGATYCVVVTQNRDDAAVNEEQLTALTRALIGTLAPSTPLATSATVTETGTLTATTAPTATTTTTATRPVTTTVPATATVAPTATAPLVFANVRLFDGEHVIPSTTVVVEDGLITAVGPDVVHPAGAQVIDGAGKTLLPSLIDAHTHVFSADALRQALIFGVTTELDMFMDHQLAARLRQEQAATGALDRADLFSAGTLATAPGGHGTQYGLPIPTLTGPEEAAAFVQERVAEGSDYIKIVIEDGQEMGFTLPTLDQAMVAALVEAAHAAGKLTVTHVQTLAAAKQALAAGTDGLAHIFVDAVPDEAFVERAVESDLFVIPTLVVFQSIGSEPVDRSLVDDPQVAPYLGPQDVQSLLSPYRGFEQLSRDNGLEAVRLLFDAGVAMLAGTDAGNPGTVHGASLHRELVLLTDAGLSPIEALRAATAVTADTFSLNDRGRIAPGLRADLLLVNGDPTTTITATRDIVGVWKLGVPVDRAAYLAALEAQRAAAAAQQAAFAEGAVAVVSDFEDGTVATTFGTAWQVSTDELAGGASTAELRVVDGGADGSDQALAVTGAIDDALPFAWGGVIFMPGATPFAPFDLSSKPTLHFWAKGDDRPYRVQLFCANLGQAPVEQSFDVTPTWQAFSFDLATFDGCDTTGVQAIVLSTGPTPGDFTFQIDEVSLRQETP